MQFNIKRVFRKKRIGRLQTLRFYLRYRKIRKNTKENPVWVHFGAGNIFRIFMGGLADTLLSAGEMQTGIACVETFDFDVIDKIYKPLTIWCWLSL